LKKILIIRPDRIGDLILALPVVTSLKKHMPEVEISVLASSYAAPLLSNHPDVNDIIYFSESEAIAELTTAIKGRNFDVAVHVFPTPRLAMAVFLAGVPERIGTILRTYSFLFNRKIWENRRPSIRHETEYNMTMLKPLGIDEAPPYPRLYLTDEEKKLAEELLCGSPRPRIIIHPGGITNLSRNWSVEKYFMLAKELKRKGSIILTGSEQERAAVKEYIRPEVTDLMGKLSLRSLMGVISEADLVVSGTTGPMHIAAALNVPTVSFFPLTSRHHPRRWRPYGNQNIIMTPDLPCDNRCGRCRHGNCVDHIELSDVIEKIETLLHVKG
jgi:lipopolysaccharide heptosyltransferase II